MIWILVVIAVLWLVNVILAQDALRSAPAWIKVVVPVGILGQFAYSITLALGSSPVRERSLALFAAGACLSALVVHLVFQRRVRA